MNNNKNIKILLVEDDDVDAMAFSRAMKKNRLTTPVIRAHDGEEAMSLLCDGKVHQPFVVILDLQMPRVNGMEFIQRVRSEPQLSNTVIFVLTSSNDMLDINRAYDQHVAGYFVKNKDHGQVEQMLKTLSNYWRSIELPAGGAY